jgi:hypothetical protein
MRDMNESYGLPDDDDTIGDDPVVPHIALHTETNDESAQPEDDREQPQNPPSRVKGQFGRGCKAYLVKLRRAGPDRHIELLLTAVITGFAITQTVNSCNNNQSTAKQVDKIIASANGINGAADSFSASAAHINDGVGSAVGTFQRQVEENKRQFQEILGQMKGQTAAQQNAVTQAGTDAQMAREDSQHALVAQTRPWLEIRPTTVHENIQDKFAEAGNSASVTYSLTNFGHAPAMKVVTASTFLSDMDRSPQRESFEIKRPCGDARKRAEDLFRSRIQVLAIYPGPPQEIRDLDPAGGTMKSLYLVGCVSYEGPNGAGPYWTAVKFQFEPHPFPGKSASFDIPAADLQVLYVDAY